MPEVRLIDANALIKNIVEGIRLADEWEKESCEKKDEQGLKYAIDTRRSLMAMLSRIKEAPTIEPEVRRGRWIDKGDFAVCTECCGRSGTQYDGVEPIPLMTRFCPPCGARMDALKTCCCISDEEAKRILGGADNG